MTKVYETGVWHSWAGGECPVDIADYESVKALCIDKSKNFYHGDSPSLHRSELNGGVSVRGCYSYSMDDPTGFARARWRHGGSLEVVAFYLGREKLE